MTGVDKQKPGGQSEEAPSKSCVDVTPAMRCVTPIHLITIFGENSLGIDGLRIGKKRNLHTYEAKHDVVGMKINKFNSARAPRTVAW